MIQLIYFVKVAPGVQLSHCVIVCHCGFFFSRKFAIGPLQRNCHMGQKRLAGRRTTWWELEKQRDYIIQKANVLPFQGPSALFAIQQGVFCTLYVTVFLAKGH